MPPKSEGLGDREQGIGFLKPVACLALTPNPYSLIATRSTHAA